MFFVEVGEAGIWPRLFHSALWSFIKWSEKSSTQPSILFPPLACRETHRCIWEIHRTGNEEISRLPAVAGLAHVQSRGQDCRLPPTMTSTPLPAETVTPHTPRAYCLPQPAALLSLGRGKLDSARANWSLRQLATYPRLACSGLAREGCCFQ